MLTEATGYSYDARSFRRQGRVDEPVPWITRETLEREREEHTNTALKERRSRIAARVAHDSAVQSSVLNLPDNSKVVGYDNKIALSADISPEAHGSETIDEHHPVKLYAAWVGNENRSFAEAIAAIPGGLPGSQRDERARRNETERFFKQERGRLRGLLDSRLHNHAEGHARAPAPATIGKSANTLAREVSALSPALVGKPEPKDERPSWLWDSWSEGDLNAEADQRLARATRKVSDARSGVLDESGRSLRQLEKIDPRPVVSSEVPRYATAVSYGVHDERVATRAGPLVAMRFGILERVLFDAFTADVHEAVERRNAAPPSAAVMAQHVAVHLRATGRNRAEVETVLSSRVSDPAAQHELIASALDRTFSRATTAWLAARPAFVAAAEAQEARVEASVYRHLRRQAMDDLRSDLYAVWAERAMRVDEADRRHQQRLAWMREMALRTRYIGNRGDLALAIMATLVLLAVLRLLIERRKVQTAAEHRVINAAAASASAELTHLREAWRTHVRARPSAASTVWVSNTANTRDARAADPIAAVSPSLQQPTPGRAKSAAVFAAPKLTAADRQPQPTANAPAPRALSSAPPALSSREPQKVQPAPALGSERVQASPRSGASGRSPPPIVAPLHDGSGARAAVPAAGLASRTRLTPMAPDAVRSQREAPSRHVDVARELAPAAAQPSRAHAAPSAQPPAPAATAVLPAGRPGYRQEQALHPAPAVLAPAAIPHAPDGAGALASDRAAFHGTVPPSSLPPSTGASRIRSVAPATGPAVARARFGTLPVAGDGEALLGSLDRQLSQRVRDAGKPPQPRGDGFAVRASGAEHHPEAGHADPAENGGARRPPPRAEPRDGDAVRPGVNAAAPPNAASSVAPPRASSPVELGRALVAAFAGHLREAAERKGKAPSSAAMLSGGIALRLRAIGSSRAEVEAILHACPLSSEKVDRQETAEAVTAAFSGRTTAWLDSHPSFGENMRGLARGAETRFYRGLRRETMDAYRHDLEAVWDRRRMEIDEARRRHQRRLDLLFRIRWQIRRTRQDGLVLALMSLVIEKVVLDQLIAQQKGLAAGEREAIDAAARRTSDAIRVQRQAWLEQLVTKREAQEKREGKAPNAAKATKRAGATLPPRRGCGRTDDPRSH